MKILTLQFLFTSKFIDKVYDNWGRVRAIREMDLTNCKIGGWVELVQVVKLF